MMVYVIIKNSFLLDKVDEVIVGHGLVMEQSHE